jgi:hypothetical protein
MLGPGRMHPRVPLGNSIPRNAGFYPLLFDGYGVPSYQPPPNVIVIQQPPPFYSEVAAQEAPSQAARMEIREYQPPSPDAESVAFTIRLKDGSDRSAAAVTVLNDKVYYIDPNGCHQRIALDDVDRAATRRINRERKLNLRLPASR